MKKILFLVRPDLFLIEAGDTVQITNLRSALKKMGFSVDISNELKPDVKNYDLVHCFNILRVETCLYQCQWIKERGKPLILTPIYWNLKEYMGKMAPYKLPWWEITQQKRKKLLGLVDLLAPNAKKEGEQIKKDFDLEIEYKVIYNGVDTFFYQEGKEKRDLILSVGRIHSRKNQLALIKALKGTNLPLAFIGKVNEPHYYRQCMEAAKGENIFFYDAMKKETLIDFYKKAKVHVLPSWYDTPGLVNLEAGLAGCNPVTTARGTAYEYLGELAWYCTPTDLSDLTEKVLQAYQTPFNEKLRDHIKSYYTWDKIARQAAKIYSEF